MIPVRLVLKDFLSYADPPPLDLTTFQVACLSGDNGVGKSALLDAMTWAVWACARGCESGQNQDRLIRDGSDEASVDLTFDLAGSRYRIVRKRNRAGKAEVRFLVRDGDAWKNVAAETNRETDAKIASVLRMDYRTFTASAFFLQGRSDDFLTRMKPDERKDVFGRLLDLGVYEKLEEAARARARDADRDRKEIELRIDKLADGAPVVASIEAELADLAGSLRDIEERSAAAAAEQSQARDALSALMAVAARLEGEQAALDGVERDLAAAAADERAKRGSLDAIDTLLARSQEVRERLEERVTVGAEESAMRRAQAEAAALDARAAELRATIDGEARAIRGRIDDLRARVTTLGTEIAALEAARTELADVDARLEGTQDIAASLAEARTLAASLAEQGARLKEQVGQLGTAIEKAERNLTVLADGEGACPVCGSTLDTKHRARVKRDIDAEIDTCGKARDAANADLEVARKEAVRCREEIARLERAQAERDELLNVRQSLLGRLERLESAASERSALETSLASDERLLREKAFAAEARTALEEIERQRSDAYDPGAHARLRARLEELSSYVELRGRLDEAARNREVVLTDIDAAARRAKDLAEAAGQHRDAIASLSAELEGHPGAQRRCDEADAAVRSLTQLAADASAEQARLQERLVAARTLHAELDQARAGERAAADAHRRYRRLVEAFGPAGIPKLIIDNALPELTEDANRILSRLSDHEMSLQFRLERPTKAGKTKETLEVLVSHDGGVRDFAMFSGGEAFRVAFAVRLAMSKLLVRRAGARLETLVIDEGFGSQDPEGRERLVEAINLAREGFSKILVITHLDELKDQFGTQIRVTKDAGGSRLEVVGS